MIAGLIFAWFVFMMCWFAQRSAFKQHNPNYSFIDDLLYFTGCPLVILYVLAGFAIAVKHPDWTTKEVFNTPLLWVLLGWMFIDDIIFFLRNHKHR